jgi:hypothetical protein
MHSFTAFDYTIAISLGCPFEISSTVKFAIIFSLRFLLHPHSALLRMAPAVQQLHHSFAATVTHAALPLVLLLGCLIYAKPQPNQIVSPLRYLLHPQQ